MIQCKIILDTDSTALTINVNKFIKNILSFYPNYISDSISLQYTNILGADNRLIYSIFITFKLG